MWTSKQSTSCGWRIRTKSPTCRLEATIDGPRRSAPTAGKSPLLACTARRYRAAARAMALAWQAEGDLPRVRRQRFGLVRVQRRQEAQSELSNPWRKQHVPPWAAEAEWVPSLRLRGCWGPVKLASSLMQAPAAASGTAAASPSRGPRPTFTELYTELKERLILAARRKRSDSELSYYYPERRT